MRTLISTFLLVLISQSEALADRSRWEPFLEEYCYDCHDDVDQEADLDLMNLGYEPENPSNVAMWERVFRKVREGEMPPKKRDRPDGADLEGFLKSLGDPLHARDRAEIESEGRVRSRRLTRGEYQNTMHDLLGIDIELEERLTADSEIGFTSAADSQQLSLFHLEDYLNAADVALTDAFDRALGKDQTFVKKFGIKDLTRGIDRGNYRGPQPFKDHLVSWSMRVQFYGRMPATQAPADGWYEITIHDAEGINRGDDQATWATLMSGSGSSNAPLQFPIGLIEGAAEPRDFVFRAWIRKGHMLVMKPAEAGTRNGKSKGGGVIFKGQNYEKQGLDGLRFSGVTMERVYPNGGREVIFGKLFPGLTPAHVKNGPNDASAHLRRLLAGFADQAFRRPVSGEELKPYEEIARQAGKLGGGFADSVKAGYHAILCSPNFLTFVEKPGPLDDHAVASRLSYMLWKSMPDAHLRELADEGRLRDPDIIASEVDRMLGDPKSERFIRSFTDEWLELRDIDATQPDPQRFRSFDPVVQESMLDETRSFFRELVSDDHGIRNLLESEFAFLNTRLQKLYGIEKAEVVAGKGLQKVRLPPGSRSGLLTQGAVLKVTADGSVTSPVVRGVYVNERILGRHIDLPPPNIPAIEPDIRGATSIREQLEKHRNSTSCASCHAKIDPAGFALEEFDPIGVSRDFYGRPGKSAKVDPSGETPEGRTFADYDEWRKIRLEEPVELAEAFAGQLLQFGTGGPVRFSDEAEMTRIAASTRNRQYGIRSLIKAVAASPLFLEK